MTVAIGVDVGTTGTRGVAVDESGAVVASATSGYELRTPRPLWTEQDPEDWWNATQAVLGRLAGEVGSRITGIGLTGQMHGSVFLDGAGEVIRPALLWNDQRTGKQCAEITERVGAERLAQITGNPALTGFQAPKVLWLRDEEPDCYARVARVLLPKDYVRFRLTGEVATDASDAAGTLFLDLRERRWSGTILDALEIPEAWLPAVHESPETAGAVPAEVATGLGLRPGIAVAAGGGDNAAAAIGTAIIHDGVLSSSIGTSGVLFAHTDAASPDPSGRIHAFCHAVPGKWCLLGVTLSAGGSLRWWRDVTGLSYEALIAEAESVPAGAEGLIFLPYLTGERTPHLDPEARGVFFGLTARHTRAHMTRALVEGVLFSLRDGLDIMRELGVQPATVVATGGGSSSRLWLRLQADVYGTVIRRPLIQEGAAYGAALLGHVAAGTFASVDKAVQVVRMRQEVIEPDSKAARIYDSSFELYRAVYARTGDLMHGLTALAIGRLVLQGVPLLDTASSPLCASPAGGNAMPDYEPLDLAEACNAGLETLGGLRRPPTGDQVFHGLPFRIGDPASPGAACFVRITPGESVTIPVDRIADRVIVAHCRAEAGADGRLAPGCLVAEYRFRLAGADATAVTVPIRERLEIAARPGEVWDASGPFLAASSTEFGLPSRYEGRWDEAGWRQTEVSNTLADYYMWVWENPHPLSTIDRIELQAVGAPVLVAAITIGNAGEHPFRREAARTLRFTALGPDGPQALREPVVDVDRGVAAYAFRLPESDDVTDLINDPAKGWGESADPESAHAYARVSAIGSATVVLKDGDREVGRFRWNELTHDKPVERAGMRVEVAEQGRNWVHVKVLDDDTGRPVPCRVAFRSAAGVPYQPHGHHSHVNSDLGTWHIDVGGDVRLGRLSYAYIDGTCQGWLPTGDVIADVARGFEYEPLRERISIAAGQRELTLRIRRWTSMSERGWYSGDSHVHFLSAQGSLTEQQGEDLNVVNLLQSQWGSLFTSTEEFTGSPIATADGRHITWVSQENRQPFFGHLVLWGLQHPVMPWCTDGPIEAELGGWLETTVSDWADRCHEQEGTVVIPHFPLPNGEPAVLIATQRADAIEMIVQRRSFHEEYYRYLNCGYRLPLVGGTDKMSADVPVGLYRTYANLGDEPFSYEAWARAVRAGRTFLSGGPMIDLRVEGREIGDCVRLSGPGTVSVSARAEGIFPMWTLELIQNGRVVASADDPKGARRLDLQTDVRVDGNCWLAARCGGPQYFNAPRHHDSWERGVFAHTSPVYVACGDGEWSQFDAEHARSMLALIEGGLHRVRQFAVRYPEGRISHHHGERNHSAFLERPFLEALERVRTRLAENGLADDRDTHP